MSYCLNPYCQNPLNADGTDFCTTCGTKLLLENRYRATKFLGAGGMGRNFLAVDERTPTLKRCVIKQFFPAPQILSYPTAYQKSVELFNTEAAMLDALGDKSTQIPRLLAHIEQDTRLYFVQEFIDGQNLLQQLQQNACYTEPQIFELLANLLPVLQFIHKQGVVHRDIKPENIMYRQNNQLVLIDFGISKELSSTVMTMGTTVGTIGYAPPEQMTYGECYPASDIYALGATCIYLLTGTSPSLLYNSQEKRWIWHDALVAKGVAISTQLKEILDKMLQEDIRQRYKSVEDILQDLQHHVPVVSIVSYPSLTPLPSQNNSQNNKLKIPLLISIAFLILGIGGYWLRQILTSVHSQPAVASLPSGSYLDSCSNIKFSGTSVLSNNASPLPSDLEAECRNIRGEWVLSKLSEYYKCKPNTIVNADGRLICERLV
ncbi:serine/threonine protein kinase [Calothrix sp. NIES-4071]|nr:serine/threonine protein kinase [Calothrix sp. NIES-4071]BAZ61074.1 serine/threonine protein kinase [Calothrix sp. NIES-4105]